MPPRKKQLPPQINSYIVDVHDPITGSQIRLPNLRAVSATHADRVARDRYWGPFAHQDDLDRLEVSVNLIP